MKSRQHQVILRYPLKRGKPTKWGKPANPELAFDLENKANPSIIEISSNITVSGEDPEIAQSEEVPKEREEENAPKENNCPEKPALPVKATVAWQIEKKGPVPTSERKHMPPKRYGIDLITKAREGQKNEEN